MKTQHYVGLAAAALLAMTGALRAAQAFPDPAGGWTYLYNGDQLQVGEPAFDGTWTHNNNSDAFKGDEIGGVLDPVNNPGNAPGGANLLTDGATQYLRIQDTGNPTQYDAGIATNPWDDPSNRKIYFGHYLWRELETNSTLAILDNGVTLTFRARVPTPAKAGGPLDPLHRDGQSTAGTYPDNGVVPYPEGGDGYITSNDAKGNFVIRQIGDGTPEHPAGAVALSLTVPTDTPGGNPDSGRAGFAGLTMNERNGPVPSGAVDFGEGSGENNFALDPTDWHEFWIAIRSTRDPVKADATHDVLVWRDGDLVAKSLKVTAGTGSDLNDGSFIATGGSATPQNFALDIDWYGYKAGFTLPEGAQVPPDVIVVPASGTLSHLAADGLEIDVGAFMPGSGISASGIQVLLDGEDISSALTLTGNDGDPNRIATYSGLQPNRQYSATVTVTDSLGLVTVVISDFDTFVDEGSLTIESEDYNDTSGFYYEDPLPGDAIAPGVMGVDYFDTTDDTTGEAANYRQDYVDGDSDTDVARAKFAGAAAPDYQVSGIQTGEWLNYTRVFGSAVLTPYLRAGADADRELRLDLVTSDRSQPNQTTKPLGLFAVAKTRTVTTYRYIPLSDAFGVGRALNLSGETTIRLTATDVADDVNHNYLYFVEAGATESTLPWAIAASPAPQAAEVAADAVIAVSLVDGDNAVTLDSIQLKFDSQDVTGALTKTDTAAGADLSYNPGGMAEGSTHTVELTYADTTGASETRTWSFTVAGTGTGSATLSIEVTGSDIVVSWEPAGGTLEESLNLSEWTAVAGATSPATITVGTGSRYYRVSQ